MDADETMTTNTTPTSSNDNEDDLFPEQTSNLPQTPQNDHLNATAPGELSPPRSQTSNSQPHPQATVSTSSAGGEHSAYLNGNGSTSGVYDPIVDSGEDVKPGHGWKNKKAVEDQQRAWENIVDKDFSLKEFGDVVAIGAQQLQNAAK